MTVVNRNDHPVVRDILESLGSRKQKAMVSVYRPGGTFNIGWDGGSRGEYYVVTTRHQVTPLCGEVDPNRMGDPFKQRRVFPILASDVLAVVRVGTFCGKPATPCIMVPEGHPLLAAVGLATKAPPVFTQGQVCHPTDANQQPE